MSWGEFLDAAPAPPTSHHADSRSADRGWPAPPGSRRCELAIDGWPLALEETDVTVAELRERARTLYSVTALEPTWDVTGSEVDIGAYLSGVPECMVDAVPRQVSRRGKVVTFLVPAATRTRSRIT